MTFFFTKGLVQSLTKFTFLFSLLDYALQTNAYASRNMTIHGGVVHAPPMAMVDGDVYTGFQIDLLEILKEFALELDNINVTFQLTSTGSNYGKALNLVANDCNTTKNENILEDCQRFDFIVGDFYSSPDRFARVDFSPAWLPSRITTAKFNQKQGFDFNTLAETVKSNAKVCIPVDTLIWQVAKERFPDLIIHGCADQSACIEELKAENCVLYIEDELQLNYRAMNDVTLTVTKERFFTQYIVWPINPNLDPEIIYLLKKWLYAAISKASPDDLYEKYFEKGVCPAGTAGENCELPCHPVNGQSNKEGICVCQSIRWTGDDCTIEELENKNLIPKYFKVIGNTMFSINVITIVCCGVWLWFKRDLRKVKLAQPSFLALVLVGCFISTTTIIPLGLESDSDGPLPACMTIPWFYSIGFSVTFGTLFSKIRRLHLIFKSASICVRRAVKTSETLKLIGIVLAIDILPLLIWTTFDPLRWKRETFQVDHFGHPLSSKGFCTSDYWGYFTGAILLIHLIVMATACYMCYVARSIPSQFSDVKYVTMAMVSNLQILLVGLPVLIIVGSDPRTSYFVRTVIVWMNDFVVVALIFGNLIYQIYFNADDELQISEAVNRFARKSRQRALRRESTARELTMSRKSTLFRNDVKSSHNGNDSHSTGLSFEVRPIKELMQSVLEDNVEISIVSSRSSSEDSKN